MIKLNSLKSAVFLKHQFSVFIGKMRGLLFFQKSIMIQIGQTYWPQIACLVAQTILTAIATLKILQNRQQFPIKQLGPISTLAAIYCFELSNIISLIGRILEENYYPYQFNHDPPIPQCRAQDGNALFYLGLVFNLVRQLPFVIFALKTLRVSICFWRYFNRTDVEDIHKCILSLFRNQAYIIYASVCYTCLFVLLIFIYWGDDTKQFNHFYYEYFCPRQWTVVETIVSVLRILMFGFVLILSIWTYEKLDFKKFIFMIFLTSNLVYIPRIWMKWDGNNFNKTTYHQFYYASMIVCLLQTFVTTFYSTQKQQLNPPPMQAVLQSWEAFHNLKLGMTILFDYAIYRDENSDVDYHFRCLESYNFLDQLLKAAKTVENFDLKYFSEPLENILQRNTLLKQKLGPLGVTMKRKCKEGQLQLKEVKKIEKILSDFCQGVIFESWKKTKSYRNLKQEFIANGDINEKLEIFDIPLL